MVFERVLSYVKGGTTGVPAVSALLVASGIVLGLAAPPLSHAQAATHYGSQKLVVNDSTNVNDEFEGIAVDSHGNLYVAGCFEAGQTFPTSICKETLQGDGSYVQSFLFNNTNNGLNGAYYVAVDSKDNVYISDELNERVLKETLSGTTYTQSVVTDYHHGLIFPGGIAVDSSGNVYVTDPNNKAVYKETLSGGTYTQSTIGSGFGNPIAVAADLSGNVFIADLNNGTVYKEIPSGGSYTQTTFLAPEFTFFADTAGLATDSQGDLFVVNSTGGGGSGGYANTVVKVTAEGSATIVTQVGSGLQYPWNIAVDSSGNLYVTGSFYHVTKLSFPPTSFGPVAVGSTSAVMSFPFTVGSDAEHANNGAALSLGVASEFTDAGTGTCDTNGTSHNYVVGETCTIDVTFSPKFAGLRSGAVDFLNSSKVVIATEYISGTGSGPQAAFNTGKESVVASGFTSPAGVAVNGSGVVYITDSSNGSSLFIETPSGSTYTQTTINISGAAPGPTVPQGVAVDGTGNVFYADSNDNFVTALMFYLGHDNTNTNLCYPQVNCGLTGPTGVAVDSNGNVYIADTGNNRVLEEVYSSGNTYNTPFNDVLQDVVATGLKAPQGVAADGSGNVYIADTGNNRILKETPSGGGNFTQSVLFDTGLSAPAGIAVDDFGDIFISDTGNKRVLQELFTGTTFTQSVVPIAGLGTPQGIAVDAAGDLYIADSTKGDVIELKIGTTPTLNFASTPEGATSSDSPQTVTVENLGNAALTFAVPTSGNNPSISANFSLSSTGATACPLLTSSSSTATLGPNATCTLPISFTPAAMGTISGSLVLTDNNLNVAKATQTIVLNGTGTAGAEPAVTLDPASLTFALQPAGTASAAKTVKLTNSGTAALAITSITLTGANSADFTLDSSACGSSLAASASCNLLVTFTPAAAGSFSASISLVDNAPVTTQTVPLTGSASSVAETGNLWFNPAPVAIALASAQTLTAHFTLTGFGSLITPTASMHYGLAYKVGKVTCTGATGNQTCMIPVTFVPNYPGGRRDALFLMNGTTRLATELAYGVGESPFALIQPGAVTQRNMNDYVYDSVVDENGTVYSEINNSVTSTTAAGVVTSLPVNGINSNSNLSIDGAGILYFGAAPANSGHYVTYDTVAGVRGTLPTPVFATYFDGIAAGNEGNIYMADNDNGKLYIVKPDGTSTSLVLTYPDPGELLVDSNENLFGSSGGNGTLDEITPALVQTKVNPNGGGLGIDAANTVYLERYSFDSVAGVAELPAVDYSTPVALVDLNTSPTGNGAVGPDGTVYVGNYTNLDKVDRSHGAPIAFGEQSNGTASQPATFQIYNGGNEKLTLATFTVTGEGFAIQTGTTNACAAGLSIAPGALCNAPIVFTGTHSGNFTGSINYSSNTLNTTGTKGSVALSAYVNGIYISAAPNPLNFGNQTVNTTSGTQTVTLTNNGVNADAGGFSTPTAVAGFNITQGTCNTALAPGASCTLDVTFSPTAAQAYTGTSSLTVGSDASTQTQTVTFTLNGTGTVAAAPAVSLTPTTLAFGNQTATTKSAAKTVTLKNTGGAALTNIALSIGGTNPADFAETTTCGTTLGAGASCTISVTFTPATAASFAATLSVADNASGSPQTVALSGTGTAPAASISPATLNFPNTAVGSTATAMSATLSNTSAAVLNISGITVTGTNPGDFAETNTCGATLAANASCNIAVTFTPASAAGFTATISVADDGSGSPQTVTLSGTGTAAPVASLSPTTLSFPSTAVGSTATAMSTTLSNTGNAVLNISGITLAGANPTDFAKTTTCGATLAAGKSCTISVTFTPATAASFAATLSVADDASGSPQTAALSGTGTTPAAPVASLSPTTLSFPDTAAGSTATAMSTTLSNTGNAVLNISGITLVGANATDFAKTTTCGATLGAGKSCTISVTFTPATAASFAATLSVADDASGSPHTAALSGTGTTPTAPVASLSPGALTFANTPTGATTAAQVLTLSNTGNAALAISGITLGGANPADFADTTTCGASLAAGASCTISVTFTPASIASFAATVSVADNAAGSPQTATLTGAGVTPPDFTVSSSTPSVTVQPGAAAVFNLAVTPTNGDFSSAVTLSVSGLPAGASASFAPGSVTPGSTAAPSVMTVQTVRQEARLAAPQRWPWIPAATLAFCVPLFWWRRSNRSRLLATGLLCLMLSAGATFLIGCGGGFAEGPPPATYTLTVTGASGADTHSTTVTLTVQ